MLKQKFDYKWIILLAAFLTVFTGLGFGAGNRALYLPAVTEALGIKRSLYSLNDTCRYAATAITNMFFGVLIYRFGVRKMAAFGFLSLCASNLIYSCADGILGLCLGGVMMGIGNAFSSTAIGSCIVRRWFKTNTGRYTGIVLAANGVGSAVAAKLISPLIYQEGNPFGYRNSYRLVALILLVIGIIVVALLREWPENEELRTVDTGKKMKKPSASGIDYATAKKRSYFYITAALIFLTGFILQGLMGVYAAHMRDRDIDAGQVATVASIFAAVLTFTKILIGMVYDKFGLRVILLICQTVTIAAFVVMLLIDASPVGVVLTVIFAVLFALAVPLETLVVPLITGDLFGAPSYDKFLGLFTGLNYAGYALSAPCVNLFYDVTGSYHLVFILFGILMLSIMVTFQLVISCVRRDAVQHEIKENDQ